MEPTTKALWKDALERVIFTFLQGFAAALILADSLDLDTIQAAALAGLMAAIAVVKVVAASQLGDAGTAQMGTKTYSYTEAGPGSAGDL